MECQVNIQIDDRESTVRLEFGKEDFVVVNPKIKPKSGDGCLARTQISINSTLRAKEEIRDLNFITRLLTPAESRLDKYAVDISDKVSFFLNFDHSKRDVAEVLDASFGCEGMFVNSTNFFCASSGVKIRNDDIFKFDNGLHFKHVDTLEGGQVLVISYKFNKFEKVELAGDEVKVVSLDSLVAFSDSLVVQPENIVGNRAASKSVTISGTGVYYIEKSKFGKVLKEDSRDSLTLKDPYKYSSQHLKGMNTFLDSRNNGPDMSDILMVGTAVAVFSDCDDDQTSHSSYEDVAEQNLREYSSFRDEVPNRDFESFASNTESDSRSLGSSIDSEESNFDIASDCDNSSGGFDFGESSFSE